MAKKVAVLAVNPVNGHGLFQYLEAFYENGIPYTVFSVAESTNIKTNSGIELKADDVIASLKGHEDQYDAMVFACGDAVPVFNDNSDKQYNKDLMEVIASFGTKGKIMVGHCAAGMFFEFAGISEGKKMAVHPYVKPLIKKGIAVDGPKAVDGNFLTAETENAISEVIPEVIEALK